MGPVLTWEALGTLAAMLAVVGAATGWIVAEISRSRRESSDGRQRLHQRLDEMRADIARTYVSRDVHEAELRTLQQALEELRRVVETLVSRLCRDTPDQGGGS